MSSILHLIIVVRSASLRIGDLGDEFTLFSKPLADLHGRKHIPTDPFDLSEKNQIHTFSICSHLIERDQARSVGVVQTPLIHEVSCGIDGVEEDNRTPTYCRIDNIT